MRILHVITGLNVGGAETMLARLMECGAGNPDVAATVVSLMAPGAIAPRIAATGTPIRHLGMRSIVPSLPAVARLVAAARAVRPDLVVGWMHHGQLAASFAAQAAPGRPPVVWMVRHSLSGFSREKATSRAVLTLGARLSRHPAAIVYNSEAARHQYRAFGYHAGRDLVIPNGFAPAPTPDRAAARARLETRFGIAPGALVVGMVARNHPMKDVPNLLRAFRTVRAREPRAHLLLVGAGMDRPDAAARALLATLPPGSWTLAGHDPAVADWLAGLDVATLASAWGEGFPNVLGEAMGAGVPCVATDVGDARHVVGDTGAIVPPEDAPALAEALARLCALDPAERLALGARAAERIATRFALDSVAARYAALFRRCAAQPRNALAPLAEASAA